MPALNKHLGDRGIRLTDFTVSTPLCCPSRVSLFTGQYAHCTNVTANHYPGGSYQKFVELGIDEDYLPLWLQNAGYDNYFFGKFLNHYTEKRQRYQEAGYYPKGWKHFEPVAQETTYRFFNACYALNGTPRKCFDGEYSTDTIRGQALGALRSIAAQGSDAPPFMMTIAPVAPHVGSVNEPRPFPATASATRHARLYENDTWVVVPQVDNWGKTDPNLYDAPRLRPRQLEKLQYQYLERLRSLRTIDEMVDALVTELDQMGVLDNTYFIYTSDNGYHMGNFNMMSGKGVPVEEDAHVPFYIRGPGIPAGRVLSYQANMIDIAPTLLSLAGAPIPAVVNGVPLPITPALVPATVSQLRVSLAPGTPLPEATALSAWKRESLILEGWTQSDEGGDADPEDSAIAGNARMYKALRLCTDYKVFPDSGVDSARRPPRILGQPDGTACYKYVAWCADNAREFFDLSTDPYEIRDRLGELPGRVLRRLDAILSALMRCQRTDCRNPYVMLHPGQPVLNFTAAMQPEHDAMYSRLSMFKYLACTNTYQPETEKTWTNAERDGANATVVG